jgi:NMD protein affecting ribosome stability and mRNA decay
MKVVKIKTGDFEAEAISWNELPSRDVLRFFAEENESKKVVIMADLIESAILDPAKAEEFKALSFAGLVEVIDAYVASKPREAIWGVIKGGKE